jgi:hypothetical protein
MEKKKCGCLGNNKNPVLKPFVLIHWKKEEVGSVTHFCKCRKRVDLVMGLSPGKIVINQYDLKDKCQEAAKNCRRTIKLKDKQ